MNQTYWCPTCAAEQVAALRTNMVAARVGAREQAQALASFKSTHAGWLPERCSHRRCGTRRMPPAVEEAVLGKKPQYPRPLPSSEAASYQAVAARNAPLESHPEHVAAAEQGDRLAQEREQRERVASRRAVAQRREEAVRRAEERARAVRKRMKALGFFEAKQPPGPRMDEADYRDFVAFKAPELAWEDCWRYGRDAMRVAVEFVCERQPSGNRAPAILRYAERVHRGLVRNWVREEVYDALPPELQAENASRHDDAYTHMEGQEDDNDLTYWAAPASEKWRQQQAAAHNRYADARRARGLTLAVKGMPQLENRS